MSHDLDSAAATPASPFAEPDNDRAGKSSRTAGLAVQRKAAEPGAAAGATPPSASHGGDDPFAMHLGGPAPLDSGVRGSMEGSFGRSFGDVRVHADSPQAGGSTQAFTQGSDIHFAPGQYDPGSTGGNWLIAHELAHVVQQSGAPSGPQRFDASEPGLGHEADADQAADAAVAGRPAVVHLSTRSGVRQNYEAWEHRQAGDANGGAGRTVTVNCGITLTYGQVVALSGDFYRSPEALMNAPRSELEAILRTMERERTQAAASPEGRPSQDQINQNNADYEMATTGPGTRAEHHDHAGENPLVDGDDQHGDPDHHGGPDHDHPHGTVHEGEHVEDNGPDGGAPASAEDAFLALADNNASHFSPENIALNYKPKHQLAIDLAIDAWRARNPGGTPGAAGAAGPARPAGGPAAPAGAAAPSSATGGSGQAAPAPAGGNPAAPAAAATPVPTGAATPDANTVSTAGGSSDAGERKEAMAILSDGFASHFLTDAFASGHLVSGSVGRDIGASFYQRNAGAVSTALRACLTRDYPAAAIALGPAGVAGVVAAMGALVSSKAGSLTLKLVHDYFNREGIKVKNKLGNEWTTVGDARLASSPLTAQYAGEAATASREGVDKAVAEGQISDEDRDRPLQYIPDQARFADGGYQPIESFCKDPTVFDSVLSATMLSSDPGANELWKLVKGNAGPMISLKLRQGGRWLGDLATGAYETVRDGAIAAGTAIRDGAVAAGGAIRDGAVAAGGAIRDGAVAAGGAIRDGAVAVRDGAVAAGGAIRDGAVAAGGAIADGARSAGRAVSDTAGRGADWVRSWFD